MKREQIIAFLILFCSVLMGGKVVCQTSTDQKKPQASDQKKQYPNLPSETPDKFEPTHDGFDYARRDVMIPMRDGVKLHTVILVPKGASRALELEEKQALDRAMRVRSQLPASLVRAH